MKNKNRTGRQKYIVYTKRKAKVKTTRALCSPIVGIFTPQYRNKIVSSGSLYKPTNLTF